MRIALDARQMFRPERRGTGKNLIDLYGTLAAMKPDWQFILVHQLAVSDPPLAGLPNVVARQVDIPGSDRFDMWEQVRLPFSAWKSRADLLHAPANTGPKFPFVPMVLTVHDLIPLEIHPDEPATQHWLKKVRNASRVAQHLITPSEYSKQRIVEVLNHSPERITVNPWAPDRATRWVEDPQIIEQIRKKYSLAPGEPYVFGFGAADPRKNTQRLLEAYAGLPASLRSEFRLLLVGIQEPTLSRFRTLCGTLGISERVTLQGFADEADIPALLSGSSVLCFPSRSEGFGLPILDAFACRTAVLTSNRTSLPEVAGDAAELIDPDNTDSLRAGLQKLLTEENYRRELVVRGIERLKNFTWDRVASTAAQVFEKIVKQR